MRAIVTLKSDGSFDEVSSPEPILLQTSSVVTLQIGPEKVARFDRVGDDLVLVLKDGTRILIENFFVIYEDGARSDLVFVDENDVTWWAQYNEPFGRFQIAEIETGIGALPIGGFPIGGIIAGVVGAAGAAGLAGGGTAAPVARNDNVSVQEAGLMSGGNSPEAGTVSTSGNVLSNDAIAPGTTPIITEVSFGGTQGTVGIALQGTYGSLTLNPDGTYTYTLENSTPETQELATGETAIDTFSYTFDDGTNTSIANINVTVVGTNDIPAISGVDTGSVSEDGILTRSGQLLVDDPDNGDTHTWSIQTPPSGGYGAFTVDQTGEWTYVLDNTMPAVQALGVGDTLTDTVTVRVTDAAGGFVERLVTVNIDGANDAPVSVDDLSEILVGNTAVLDVRINDDDVDTGEAGLLEVTQIDGQAISVGNPVTLPNGVVSIGPDGVLSFTPNPGYIGTVTIPYTVSNGAVGSDANADWVVIVDPIPAIDIFDTAQPGDPNVGDGILSTLDDLTNVALNGIIPFDSTLQNITITDGTTTVTIPGSSVTVNPDGTFTTTADLSGLNDGTLNVTMTVVDRNGVTSSPTDQIEKDTVTTVSIDPVDVREGAIPTITGTGAPDDMVSISIDGGAPVDVTVLPNGTWSYTPAAPLPSTEVNISVVATDLAGNTANAERDVASLDVTDTEPGDAADVLVDEANLSNGTNPSTGVTVISSTLNVGTGEGDVTQVTIAGTVVTLPELAASGITPVGPISTTYGTITVTGYNSATGEITFDFEVDSNAGHTNSPAVDAERDVLREAVSIIVEDNDGDTRDTTLNIAVVDDIPQIATVPGFVAELDAADADLGTDPSASFAGLFDIDHGADSAASTVYGLAVGSTASGLSDGASGDPIVLSLESGVVVGRVGGTGPDAGAIALRVLVDPATGVVMLDQQRAIDHADGGGANVAAIVDSAVQLSVVATDGDGDIVSQSIDIGARLRFVDDLPVAVNDTDSVAASSTVAITGNIITDVAGQDDIGADSPGVISQVQGAGAVDPVPGTGTVVITGTYGDLTISADGGYSYLRNPGTPGDVTDVFTYTLEDADGDTDTATLTINIGDAPVGIGGLTDQALGGDAFANESQLPNGSGVGSGGSTAADSFTISSFDGVADLTVSQGGTSTNIITNNTLVSGPIVLTSALGSTLTITGYDAGTGVVSYTYALSDAETHGVAGRDAIFEAFDLSLTDLDGDTATDTLSIRIDDDIASATAETPLTVVENGAALGTAAGDPNLLDNDTLGADGARLNDVTYRDDAGVTQTVTIAATASGTGPLDAQFGTLEVNADGTWSFAPDASIPNLAGAPVDASFSYNLIDGDGDVSANVAQPITVTDTSPVAVDDAAVTLAEGAAAVSGNVITNDTPSADAPTELQGFTYTNAAGVATTASFSATVTTQTVPTPTGDLTVNADGSWSFTPDASFDHDAPGADAAAGSFSYTLVDADGSVSNSASQSITVTDTAPGPGAAAVTLDEANLPGTGSVGVISGDPEATQSLGITRTQDDIANVVFTAATISGLQALSSNGTPLVYAVSPDGHTLTATAGAAGPAIFTMEINNPTDATGATQSVTVTLSGPIDQPGLLQSQLTVAYEVQDIDSSAAGAVIFTIVDDTPVMPVADTPVTVVEGGAAVGSANAGDNLLSNDVPGADAGRVYDITYTNTAGAAQTVLIPDAGSETVTTEYGSLTVASDGTWSYTPNSTVDHTQPANDTALNDNFTYRTIDGDSDISPGSATQVIEVTDTVPTIGDPADGAVTESGLSNGSAPNAANVQATGSLDVISSQDTIDVTLTSTPAGLMSKGLALEYVFAPDNQSVVAYAGAGRAATDQVFTLDLVNPTGDTASYDFTLLRSLDHTASAPLNLDFGVTVIDSDDDVDTDSFRIVVADDAAPSNIAQTIAEEGSFAFNTSADSTVANTVIRQGGVAVVGVPDGLGNVVYTLANGVATIRADGSTEYVPAANFRGSETFIVRTNDNGTVTDTTVDMTVTPVADAPTLGVDAASVAALEDTSVALGLQVPVITDDGTGTGNNPTSERIGAITITGLPENAELRDASDALLFTVGATPVTIVISDVPTVTGTTGTLILTTAQYEALQVRPPLDTSENFTVTANVSSFEVDGSGGAVGGGAPATPAAVEVLVQAVTDDAALVFDTSVGAASVTNADAIVYTGNTLAEIDLNEDTQVNLKTVLEGTFADIDGSEARSILITNTTGQTIRVGNTDVAPGAGISIAATGQAAGIGAFGEILIGGAENFSGELDGITITVVTQDVDSDGFSGGVAGADGVPEADTTNNTVTLNLNIAPVSNDVSPSVDLDVTTAEDTSVAFLENLQVTDSSNGVGGTEVINSVTFDIPAGWDFTPSTVSNGATFTVDQSGAPTVLITFSAGSQADREAVLDGFEMTPPAHSSLDASVDLSIDLQDTNATTGSDTQTVSRTVEIEVTPVAEVAGADTDGNATDDLTLTPGFAYTTPGAEDRYFDLNSDGFNLAAGWTNEDGDELSVTEPNTYALLTPDLNGSSAIGAKFRWVENGSIVEQTFGGAAIQIPVASLGTVEFLAPPNESGTFSIGVQALTEDFDDDDEGTGTPDSATGGSAQLTSINILPVADAVSLTLGALVVGQEDTDIPLSVRPSSSDPDETFNIVITDIPVGAVVTYDGTTFTATSGNTDFPITDFDPEAPLSVQAPLDSNEDFTLNVQATSVDTAIINGTPVTSTSAPPITLPIEVIVQGVPDEAIPTLTPQTYDEALLDAGTVDVVLSDLVSFAVADPDLSEALTVQISGLPEGFRPTEGALISPPSFTGTDRVWSLNQAQFAVANIIVPENLSGDFSFLAGPVTTENDGRSQTAVATSVSFTVTPAPEATVSTSAVLVEDVVSPLNLQVVTQNDDTDERIAAVRIPVADATTATFDLYLGTGVGAEPLVSASVPIVNDGGVNYYVLSAAQAADLSALTAPNLDNVIGDFELQYQIVDDTYDGTVGPTATTSPFQSTTFSLTATPVTDTPDATITAITGAGTSTITDALAGDDAVPDTASLSAADILTVTLNVESPDYDGTERVIRVVIENVPNGVTVLGAEVIGLDSWLLTLDAGASLPINSIGGTAIPIVFDVSEQVVNLPLTQIDMTVQVQDRGDQAEPGTLVQEDTVSWILGTTIGAGGPPAEPASIIDWEYTGTGATEDAGLVLSDAIDATIAAQSSNPNTLTVQITNLPPGANVQGMVRSVINGVETFTASATSAAGSNPAQVQALLDGLLDNIVMTAPENSNENNAPGGLSFVATLTTKVLGGTAVEQETISPTIPTDPVTDPATLGIALGAADIDGKLDETDSSVPISITVENMPDGAAGSIVGGDLYLQVNGSVPDLQGGTLTNSGGTVTYPLTSVSGVSGIADGDYYVIPGTTMGSQVDVVYAPTSIAVGDISVTATVVNIETGSVEVTSTDNEVLSVVIGNNGAIATSDPTTGTEAAESTTASLIQLANLTATLVDSDGSEDFVATLLSNVPEGFLVFAGADQASATPGQNAGGNGTTNTWILAGEGETLPAYVAVLPPVNWSGTLTGLQLVVTSGETTLEEARSDTFAVGDVTMTPVANGATVLDSSAFGTEGEIVGLNLAVSINDPQSATTSLAAPDENTETATLVLTGLGANTSFFIGTTEKTDNISYNGVADAYTISGLVQSEIDTLGVRQVADAFTDQDGGQTGTQIGVSVTTTDGADVSAAETGVVSIDLFDQVPTLSDDTLLYSGAPLDALDGEDTIDVRSDENLTGDNLAANLSNIETLDLGVAGANLLDDVSPEDLEDITDADNQLTVTGTADDTINLSGMWTDDGGGVYTGTDGGTSVTLTVTGGVQVGGLAAGFALAAPAPFGLAFLSAPKEEPQDDAAVPAFADVFSAGQDTTLEGLLPGKDDAPAPSVAAESTGGPDLAGSPDVWEDDAQDSAVYEA